MNPITIGPDTFTSVSDAWRATGKIVPLSTVRRRLARGWETHDAFYYPVVIPQDRRRFKHFRDSIDELTF